LRNHDLLNISLEECSRKLSVAAVKQAEIIPTGAISAISLKAERSRVA
jgi:hypothetical protein